MCLTIRLQNYKEYTKYGSFTSISNVKSRKTYHIETNTAIMITF